MGQEQETATIEEQAQEGFREGQEGGPASEVQERARRRRGPAPTPQERLPLHEGLTKLADLAREIDVGAKRLELLRVEWDQLETKIVGSVAEFEDAIEKHMEAVRALRPSVRVGEGPA